MLKNGIVPSEGVGEIQLLQEILKIMPKDLSAEILSRCKVGEIPREIRLRKRGASVLVLQGGSATLRCVGAETVSCVFSAVCRGAPYAYRDSILRGYIPFFGGVRVGIAGRAHDDEGKIVGVSDVDSLVFRLPTGKCDFSKEINDICLRARGGVLIFSPPLGGKTTALRALAAGLSAERRVVIVDEREEIYTNDLLGRNIDLLSGYRRALGIGIATRCFAPETIITDEISADDAEDILDAANCGVPIIATAHAGNLDELFARRDILRLIEAGVFSTLVGIYNEGGRFVCREEVPTL